MSTPGESDQVGFVNLPTVTGILALPRQVALRYGPAIRAYLEGRFGVDLAEEIAAEMALKILQGGIATYDRSKGRFRPYLKQCVTHLVMDHFRERHFQELPDDAFTEDPTSRNAYTDELLRQADLQLKRFQEAHPGNLYHTLIGLLAANAGENPNRPNYKTISETLTSVSGQTITEAHARVLAHRARHKFAQLVIDQVGETLDDPSPANIVDELKAIGLFSFLEDFLPPEWTKR